MKLTRENSFNMGFEYDLHILGARTAIPKELNSLLKTIRSLI